MELAVLDVRDPVERIVENLLIIVRRPAPDSLRAELTGGSNAIARWSSPLAGIPLKAVTHNPAASLRGHIDGTVNFTRCGND